MRHVRETMRRAVLASVVAILFPVVGTAEQVTDVDRFQLWNDCKPVSLVVEGLHSDATDIGLTKEAITVAARSRLRSARIYNPDLGSYLYINVNVVGLGFGIGVEFYKLVRDISSQQIGQAITWDSGSAGQHGKNPDFLISSVSKRMDRFIDEYLRVNADACTR